jgi:tripartite-type tricarboxylate transporter receptor subunit TctC
MRIDSGIARRAAAASLLIAGATFGAGGHAADFPSRALRYVVAFGPGGLNDVVGRAYCQRMSEILGQPVIVDNRPGAGGNVGAELVARSTPDGHTMLSISTAHAIAQSLYGKLKYSLEKDLTPVAQLGSAPLITVVHPSLPVKNLAEMVTHARSKRLAYGSGGVGVISHLAMEMFKQAAKFDATHVPYKGGGPALVDLLAGQVQLHTNDIGLVLPSVRAGKLRPVGMMTEGRHPLQPDVPTYIEQGHKDFVMGNWIAVVVPSGTPKPVVDRLSSEFARIAREPEIVKLFAEQGFDTTPLNAAQTTQLIRKEVVRFGAAVKASGAKVD